MGDFLLARASGDLLDRGYLWGRPFLNIVSVAKMQILVPDILLDNLCMRQPRQILHLISLLDGYGQSKQMRQLVQRQLADGYRVRIVALSANRRERFSCEQAGVDCRVLDQRWPYDPIAAWRLAQEFRQPPFDLLHIWGAAALRYAGFVLPAPNATPCVATLAELPSRQFNAWVDRFVLTSPQECQNEQTVIISPGVASEAQELCPREEFLKALRLPEDARIITIAGQLTRDKSFEEAIWCFELVRTLDESACLIFFGDGPDRHRLERFARLASDANAIRFLGYREDLSCWLPHAEVFWQVTGSQPPEGPPLAVLEAMASQVPVVATDVSAHRQLIEQGRTGSLFPAASRSVCARHTMRFLQDSQHAAAIAVAAGEEVTRQFSLSGCLDAYSEVYDQLLSTH